MTPVPGPPPTPRIVISVEIKEGGYGGTMSQWWANLRHYWCATVHGSELNTVEAGGRLVGYEYLYLDEGVTLKCRRCGFVYPTP